MHAWGKIVDGQLAGATPGSEGAKPVAYAEIPGFDQTMHYVRQLPPVDANDHIYMGVEVLEMEAQGEPEGEEPLS